MAGVAFLNGFATMGDSFMRAFRSESERLRREKKDEADAAWVDEQRGRQRKTWAQEDQEQEILADAYKADPVEAAPVPADGTAPAAPTNGAAVAAGGLPTEASSSYKKQLKAADALQAVNPRRAIELRNSAMQTRAAEITLSKAEREEVDNHYNTVLVSALDSAPVWYEGAANFAREVGKANIVPEVSKDGAKVSMYMVGPEGERKLQGTYESGEAGKLKFLEAAAKLDPKAKMAMLHANMLYERQRADKVEDREATLAGQERIAKFQHGLALSRDAASEARAAGRRAADSKEASARAAAGVALFKENNPNATPAQLEAVRLGILSAAPKEPKAGGYKVEAGDVATLLGTPATDPQGNPLMDPLTGRQVVNRNPQKERELFEFMRDNNITDTNEGLQKFMAPRVARPAGPAAAKLTAPPTDADIKATAKKYGISEAEVRKRLGL